MLYARRLLRGSAFSLTSCLPPLNLPPSSHERTHEADRLRKLGVEVPRFTVSQGPARDARIHNGCSEIPPVSGCNP